MDKLGIVRDLIEATMNEKGYKIHDIEYVKEGPNYFLRVIIDKDGVVDIDDCVLVSNLINPILDKEDPIKENYILDVCSKGSEE